MRFFFTKKGIPNVPEYWKKYTDKFKEKDAISIPDTRFVVFDTETTGFNLFKDRILSIGALSIVNSSISVKNSLEIYLAQKYYDPKTASIHGILKNEKTHYYSEEEGLVLFLNYIENAVLVGHHIQFDINMINKALARMELPELKNHCIDTANLYKKTLLKTPLLAKKQVYSLDEIATKYDISVKDRHTAMGDAYITAIAFLKIIARLEEKDALQLGDLYTT